MAVRIKFDNSYNAIQPTFVLANRNGDKLGYLPAVNVSVSDNLNSAFNLEFKVYKYDGVRKCELWDKLTDLKLVWCREWDVWFEASVVMKDNDAIVKEVTCTSLGEAELSQVMLYGIQINTEDDISRDDYSPTILYDPDHTGSSLLHRIMQKVPHYTVRHVDTHIANIQRTFTFNDISLLDALMEISEEIDCIVIIDSGSDEYGKPVRGVSIYDLESYCTACGQRSSFQGPCPECGSNNVLDGYGEDTTIFVSTENLAEEISFSTDVGSVKNCFRLEGGDDLMTAAIIACNPNGSQYIWYISDEMREDMPNELSDKLSDYINDYDYYLNNYPFELNDTTLTAFNQILNKYSNNGLQQSFIDAFSQFLPTTGIESEITGYTNLMNAYYDVIDLYIFLHDSMLPSTEPANTTALLEVEKLNDYFDGNIAVQNSSVASASTVESTALSLAKIVVDPRYQVSISHGDGGYSGMVIFAVTSYTDSTDTAESDPILLVGVYDNIQFAKQKIDRVLRTSISDGVTDLVSLYGMSESDFEEELGKFSLTSLELIKNCGQACLDILVERGIANDETWATSPNDPYDNLYVPYYNKLSLVNAEITTRTSELETIAAMRSVIETHRDFVQNELNLETYLGHDLWLDFAAYRREDTFNNPNFISDGLNNAELFNMAKEFLGVAQKEISKSATMQHSLSASLKNLLVMKEFRPIVDMFSVGNWIRVKADESVYRLRLVSYQIDFDNIDDLSIEFSDYTKCPDGISDTEDILNAAASIASTYDFVARQARKGSNGNEQLSHWVSDGLALTKIKIIDNADNQNVSWDEHGILCREYLPFTDDYSDKQLKIINRGLYFTNDNWMTAKAGIGDFTFFNPHTGNYEEGYGVIADTLVGDLILGQTVGVYNVSNSVVLDENGLTITSDEDYGARVFTIQRRGTGDNGEEKIDQYMYLDGNGRLVFTGSIIIRSNSTDASETLNSICDIERFTPRIQQIVNTEAQIIHDTIEEKYQAVIDNATAQLESYKADIGQYMQFNDDGLTLGALTSTFKTVIDNRGVYFRQGDATVAYINNNQLYIPNAVIQQTLCLGNFFFNPRSDGGVSLTWQG